MARLPKPGGDAGEWGDILNDFLRQEHNDDGTLKSDGTLAAKADQSALDQHLTDTDNPHQVTTSQLGLDHVDNTADADKPISDATQAALDGKLDADDAPELIRDTMGTALVAGDNIKITPDDGADTITVAAVADAPRNIWFGLTSAVISSYTHGWTPSQTGNSNNIPAGLSLSPLRISEPVRITAVTVTLLGAVAGGHMRLGLFRAGQGDTVTTIHDYGTAPLDVSGTIRIDGLAMDLTEPGEVLFGTYLSSQTTMTGYRSYQGYGALSFNQTYNLWGLIAPDAVAGPFAPQYAVRPGAISGGPPWVILDYTAIP